MREIESEKEIRREREKTKKKMKTMIEVAKIGEV